jgi:basic membrane lipoprotein Med (substrate-binding protein (PBP1-ABC) superfamily)/TolB-like protein
VNKRRLLLLPAFAAAVAASALPKVAVLDLVAQKGVDPSVVIPITESVMEEVVASRAYVVLDRAFIVQVLKEKEFQLSGLVSDSQATAAGQYLGADYVVTGRIQLMGEAYFVVAKMIEVKTGVIVSQSSEQGEGKSAALLSLARSLGRKLVAGAAGAVPGGLAPAGSGAAAKAAAPREGRVKAGFILRRSLDEGPWTHPQALGVVRVRERLSGWLDVAVAEWIEPSGVEGAVARLVREEGCQIVFGTYIEDGEALIRIARSYPEVVFEVFHGPWLKDKPHNYGIYHFSEDKFSYLQGLLSGALSAKGKIGYLALPPGDEGQSVFYANLFALGVRAGNPRAQVFIRFLPSRFWETEGLSRKAAEAFIAEGCDFLGGWIEPEVIATAEAATRAGKRLRLVHRDISFTVTPEVIVAGPMMDFSVRYERALVAFREGRWKQEDFLPGIWDDGVKFGGGGPPFNPLFAPEVEGKKVKTPDLGERLLPELIELRIEQLKREGWKLFAGPLKDQKGQVRVPAGVNLEPNLFPRMDWLLDNVKGTIPK